MLKAAKIAPKPSLETKPEPKIGAKSEPINIPPKKTASYFWYLSPTEAAPKLKTRTLDRWEKYKNFKIHVQKPDKKDFRYFYYDENGDATYFSGIWKENNLKNITDSMSTPPKTDSPPNIFIQEVEDNFLYPGASSPAQTFMNLMFNQ